MALAACHRLDSQHYLRRPLRHSAVAVVALLGEDTSDWHCTEWPAGIGGAVWLINASTTIVIQKQEITDIIKHDTPFAVCLFPVVNGTLFVQKKLGLRLVGLGLVATRH